MYILKSALIMVNSIYELEVELLDDNIIGWDVFVGDNESELRFFEVSEALVEWLVDRGYMSSTEGKKAIDLKIENLVFY